MRVTELMSGLAAARKRWFDLIESLEKEASCQVDEAELEAAIDCDYDGRETVTDEEANALLMQVSRRKVGGARTGT